jgi:hypothetical protein
MQLHKKDFGSREQRRSLQRLPQGIFLATFFIFFTGCSALSLHQTPPPEHRLTNPWIKPAKEEKTNWFTNLFWREKKKPSPSEWLANPRPE